MFVCPDRALQLMISRSEAMGSFANVEAVRRPGGAAPIIHDTHGEAARAAVTLREELTFLYEHGVRLHYATLRYLTTGRSSLDGVRCTKSGSIYVGRPSS